MARVEFVGINKSFGATQALGNVSCSIDDGEFVVIVGPSGCGKSTLLRLVAGLEAPDSGRILFDGKDITHQAPKDRGVAMVFQSYALYPHWSVSDNIAFPLKVRHRPKSEIDRRVREIADSLRLTAELQKRPKELSGGQRQRVALGRAIAADPGVLLFDEPLSNLDAPLRAEMRREIVFRQKSLGKTAIYVTHDQTEALTMADRIVVLQSGSIMGIGAPLALYENPPNRFVAQFLGRPPINIIAGHLTRNNDGTLFLPYRWKLDGAGVSGRIATTTPFDLGVRPEHLVMTLDDAEGCWKIDSREFLGDKIQYLLLRGSETIVVVSDSHSPFQVGAEVCVRPHANRLMFFDQNTGLRLA